MNKYTIKKILLLIALPVYLAAPATYGWNGPCIGWSDCGNVGGGMGTCRYNLELGHCVGKCTSKCPSGPPDKFCLGVTGDCTSYSATCSTMIEYFCHEGSYTPDMCECVEYGIGPPCPRNMC